MPVSSRSLNGLFVTFVESEPILHGPHSATVKIGDLQTSGGGDDISSPQISETKLRVLPRFTVIQTILKVSAIAHSGPYGAE
jgi:hypothetical protein